MSIPIHTTTISVLRVPEDAERDPYDAQPEAEVIASGVRAHISTGGGSETVVGGTQEVVTHRLSCDPTDIDHDDRIEDAEGQTYDVVWVSDRVGLGMDHTQAGLKRVSGHSVGAAA